MPFNGSGTFTKAVDWATEAASPPVSISNLDTSEADIATGLSNCITKDGQTTITSAIPFNDKRITGLGNATADADALNRVTADARYVRSGAAASVTTLSITEGAVISGTYTPTLTQSLNVSASTSAVCQYIRVGSVVTVSGVVQVTCTSGTGNSTQLGISLPVASNFAAAINCGGAGQHNSSPVGIFADGANDRAAAAWFSSTASDTELRFTFTYRII